MQLVICVLGEAMLEFSAGADNRAGVAVAGDTFNTAVGLAQLGEQVSYLTGLGADSESGDIYAVCKQWDVGTELIVTLADKIPGRYTIHLNDQGERSFSYDRDNSAARALFSDTGLLAMQLQHIAPAQWIYLSGITLAIASQPCRDLLMEFLNNYRSNNGRVVFDCNHRPLLWENSLQAQQCYLSTLQHCDLFFAGEEDIADAFSVNGSALFDWLELLSVPLSVLKCGSKNMWILDAGQYVEVAVKPVHRVIDSTGAGDIFNAGFLSSILAGHSPAIAAEMGQRLSAECLQHCGALLPADSWQHLRG